MTMFDIWTIVYLVSFFEKSGSCLQNCISNHKYSQLLILLVYSIKYIRRHYLSATGWHNIKMIVVVWKICGSYEEKSLFLIHHRKHHPYNTLLSCQNIICSGKRTLYTIDSFNGDHVW